MQISWISLCKAESNVFDPQFLWADCRNPIGLMNAFVALTYNDSWIPYNDTVLWRSAHYQHEATASQCESAANRINEELSRAVFNKMFVKIDFHSMIVLITEVEPTEN